MPAKKAQPGRDRGLHVVPVAEIDETRTPINGRDRFVWYGMWLSSNVAFGQCKSALMVYEIDGKPYLITPKGQSPLATMGLAGYALAHAGQAE